MHSDFYNHIFFDLDRTLWDFDTNAAETFNDIYLKHDLPSKGITDFNLFMDVYHEINHNLWEDYRKGTIVKEVLNVQRFALTLEHFGIYQQSLSEEIAIDYITLSPTKNRLFPDAHKILKYLSEKYWLHIITNGFKEVQEKKLINSQLDKYFTTVVTSEDAGSKKPDVKIFEYALLKAKAAPEHSLMIGDDPEVDIIGAKNAGIDQVLIDFHGVHTHRIATYYVRKLIDLTLFL